MTRTIRLYESLAIVLSHYTKIDALYSRFSDMLHQHQSIRAVFYHDTPPCFLSHLEDHLDFYRKHYSPVSLADLKMFFRTKRWPYEKPGLIISFDDGFRSHYDIAFPLLREYGFIGWFFIPTDFIGSTFSCIERWLSDHYIKPKYAYPDSRLFMTWDEIRELDRNGYVIGSHTVTHRWMYGNVPAGAIETEISKSKLVIEEKLGHEIDTFAWVGGELTSINPASTASVVKSGYRFSFLTCRAPILPDTHPLQLHRTSMEAWHPVDVVRFRVSGITDFLFSVKKKRINRQFSVGTGEWNIRTAI